MSATQTQTTIEVLLLKEAESLSQLLYGKPYTELDEQRQKLMMTGARKFLQTRMSFPGECCDCGARIDEDKYQCRRCHEGITGGEIAYDNWQNRRGTKAYTEAILK